MFKFKTFQIVSGVMSVAVLTLTSISGLAQQNPTNPNNPGVGSLPVLAQSVGLPSSSAKFGLDITSCRATFDWTTYIADQRAGRTNSNPYIDQGCVSQTSAVVDDNGNGVLDRGDIRVSQYANFAVGQASTKTAFGTDPVLGIFQNGTFPAQSLNTYDANGNVVGNRAPVNRGVRAGVNNIFTVSQLGEIFSTTGGSSSTSNIPRIFSTGPDTYATNAQGQQVYQGGWCRIENGQIFVRTQRAGTAFNPSLYGRNPATPLTSCARTVNGTLLPNVEDQNLKVYQFVFEMKYPTAAQCLDWFGVDAATCTAFFNNRYGRDLAGNNTNTGSRVLSVYTFYGSFDDKYTKWVGWTNPDVNGPRMSSTDGFVRGYDGFSVYEL